MCDAKVVCTEMYQERPKLGLYGESGVRCSVEGAQTDVRERGPGSASSAHMSAKHALLGNALVGVAVCEIATPALPRMQSEL